MRTALLVLLLSASTEASGAEDDEVAGGLTLQVAIDRLLECNGDLRIKYQEISEARADELTASLRNAPVIFANGHQLPYGRFSPQQPGVPSGELAPTRNVDYSGKRRSHMRQAAAARREIEARYQDAVRLTIDRLYGDYVAVLEADGEVRAARQRLARLINLTTRVRTLVQRGIRPETEIERAMVQQFNARMNLQEAEARLLSERRDLATLLAIPADRADRLQVRDVLPAPSAPPCAEELLRLARESRPDLAATRLSIEHDETIVQVTRTERFDDAIVFYVPYEAQDYRPQGKQSAADWGTGAVAALPAFDRNQGRIARARVNVVQRQIELQGLERRLANDVQRGLTEYLAAWEAAKHFEHEQLPAIGRLHDERLRRYAAGQEELESYLSVEEKQNEENKRYRQTRARFQHSMLKLNTIVGQRIFP